MKPRFLLCAGRWALSALLAVGFASSASAHAQDSSSVYFLPANILRFADHLFAEGEFGPALAEYKRFLLADAGTASERAKVHLKVGLSYRMLDDVDSAVEAFKAAADTDPSPALVRECRVQVAYTYLLAGRWDDADAALNAASTTSPGTLDTPVENLRGARYLLTRQWRRASDHFTRQQESGHSDAASTELAQIATEGLAIRHRSPWVGGVLSAVVPGAGRIYAGRKADGLLSMVAISLTGWQAYRGFHRDGRESVRGWVFGSIGAFMYVGNVYGSVVSVKLTNESRAEILVKRTGVSLSVAVR